MTERRRLDAAIRRRIAVQHVEPELLADRAPIFERRIDRLVRSAEHLGGSEPWLGPALGRDVQHRGRLVSILRLHAAENDIRPFPCPRRNHIGEGGRHGIRNRHTVDTELEVRMILPNMHLLERSIDGARNRDEHVL